MAPIPKVKSEDAKITSFEDRTIPIEKSPAKNIFLEKQELFITDPIDPERISKKSTDCLNVSSVVKAVLVFAGTIGLYNLFKNTSIFSYFKLGEKDLNSKDIDNKEIVNAKKSLSVRTNLETTRQVVNNPKINRNVQTHKGEGKTVKFEKIKVEEFKDFSEVKEKNVGMRKSSSRRSISVQNPIPDQNAAIGKPFGLTIDENHVFSSNSALSLEAINIPAWLMLTPLNINPTLKGSYETSTKALGVALSSNYVYVTGGGKGLQIVVPNLDELTLSGMPMSVGTYSVDIKACNKAEECISDSFDIIVKRRSSREDLSTFVTIIFVTVGSCIIYTVGGCIIYTVSFFLSLIVCNVIVNRAEERRRTTRIRN